MDFADDTLTAFPPHWRRAEQAGNDWLLPSVHASVPPLYRMALT